MKKEKESAIDVVQESKNDIIDMPFEQAFPATEELQSNSLTLEDAHIAPRRVQGQAEFIDKYRPKSRDTGEKPVPEIFRNPITSPDQMSSGDHELDIGREQYFMPDVSPSGISEVRYDEYKRQYPENLPSMTHEDFEEAIVLYEYNGLFYSKNIALPGAYYDFYGEDRIFELHIGASPDGRLPQASLFSYNDTIDTSDLPLRPSNDPVVEKFIDDVPKFMELENGWHHFRMVNNLWRPAEISDDEATNELRLASVTTAGSTTLICIEPPEDVVSDIMAECAGLQFVDDFKIVLARCTGSAYDVGAAINGEIDVDLSVSFKGDGYIADSDADQALIYYHMLTMGGVPALLEQIGESLEVSGIASSEQGFAPNMKIGVSQSAIAPAMFSYSWKVDELIVDDGANKVPVRVTSSGAKMQRSDSQNGANSEEKEAAVGWNLSDLVSPGLGSNTMEDINQSSTDPNVFEDPRGRMAQISTTTSGTSPRGSKIVSIKNGADRYIYNLSVPGKRLMVLSGSMPQLTSASVPVDSLFEDGADTLSNEDAMLGDHLADLAANSKSADVELPYSQGDGPLGVRFEDDKEYNIVRGAQLKELKREPTNLSTDDKELEIGREQYFMPDSNPENIEEVEYELPDAFEYEENGMYAPPADMYNVANYSTHNGVSYRKPKANAYAEYGLYDLSSSPGIFRSIAIGMGDSGIPMAALRQSVEIPDSASIYNFTEVPGSDPIIEKFIDDVPDVMLNPQGTYLMVDGTWTVSSDDVSPDLDSTKLAQVDWDNATPEQLRLRDLAKSRAKSTDELNMYQYETYDSSEPVTALPSTVQVAIDKAQEDFPGIPSVLSNNAVTGPTRDEYWAPPLSIEKIPGTNMVSSIHAGREPGEYALEDLATDKAYWLDIGIEPDTAALLASWQLTSNWFIGDEDVCDSTDPVIDEVLPQIVQFMRASDTGTARKGDRGWHMVAREPLNLDTRLAGSSKSDPVIIDDEIEKDAVGLIEGPAIDENSYGTDFSRADQAIPRQRGMDKFIHRK